MSVLLAARRDGVCAGTGEKGGVDERSDKSRSNSQALPALDDSRDPSMKWLRLYDEFVDDPKIQNLPLELRMALVNLWCVASQNDGRFPSVDDMAFKLHFKPAKMRKILADLSAAGFIDEDETGLFPHNWRKRQFKSDDNYDRVKRFRSRNKDSPETADETFQSNDLKRPQSQSQSQSQSQRESHQPPKEVDTTRARSLISPEAHTIADAIGQAAGFSKENCVS